MNFYKVHAAKFKELKILFVPEQFDEIGPDAFSHTKFEIIVLSRKLRVIRNHAFSGLKKCKVYIPKTVTEIEPLSFEDIDSGNEFYCVSDSEAYKICSENNLKINENVEQFLEYAEKLWQEQEEKEKQEKAKKEAEKPADAEPKIKNEALVTNTTAKPEVSEKDNKVEPTEDENVAQESQEIPVQTDDGQTDDGQADDLLFIQVFGLPPSVKDFSQMGEQWQKQISLMDTQSIINNYDDADYCDEYRGYCYSELKRRFKNNQLNLTASSDNKIQVAAATEEEEDVKEESVPEYNIDSIADLLGLPPECQEFSELNGDWKKQIKLLSTSELLERYDSEEWCDEYKYLCYLELSTRDDLEEVLLKQ